MIILGITGFEHDATAATATLYLTQDIPDTPGQTGKQPMVIPLKLALIGETSGAELGEERVVTLDQASNVVTFESIGETPLLSINRQGLRL